MARKKRAKITANRDASEALAKLEKQFETAPIYFDTVVPIPRLDTGITEFTDLIDDGWPKGRMVEMFAVEGVGKTSVGLQTCGLVQARFLKALENGEELKSVDSLDAPGRAAFIDVEKKYDASYAQTCYGILHPKQGKNKRVIDNGYRLYQPLSAEDAANLIDGLVRSCMFDFIVVDSAAAMCPRDELDGDVGDQHRQKQARILTQHIRKVANYVKESGTVLLYLNQSVQKGVNHLGKPMWEAPGARAFKHYAALRIMLSRGKKITAGDKRIGHYIRASIYKNQTGPTQGESILFRFYYGKGFCKYMGIIEKAIALDIIEKSGSWYSYDGKRIGQGLKKVRNWAEKYETTFEQIREEVRNAQEVDDDEFPESQEDDFDTDTGEDLEEDGEEEGDTDLDW
jgi:recombination protein RecA